MTPKYIRFPVTDMECLAAMATFNDQPIPNCVGTIDGSHIRIIRPNNYSTDYYNFKGYYSVLLQAVCDGNWNLSLSCGHPGSIHDATMMRRSGFTGKSLQRCKLMFQLTNLTNECFFFLRNLTFMLLLTLNLNKCCSVFSKFSADLFFHFYPKINTTFFTVETYTSFSIRQLFLPFNKHCSLQIQCTPGGTFEKLGRGVLLKLSNPDVVYM